MSYNESIGRADIAGRQKEQKPPRLKLNEREGVKQARKGMEHEQRHGKRNP